MSSPESTTLPEPRGTRNATQKIGSLFFWITLSYLPALTGIFFMPGEWYQSLVKAPLNPPDWIFAPVWTILYFMMGVSAWLIWNSGTWKKTFALLSLYLFHLGINALWSFLFFGLQNPCYALVDIGILCALIIFLIILFSSVNRLAAALLIPYLLWCGFATYLNFYIWWKN